MIALVKVANTFLSSSSIVIDACENPTGIVGNVRNLCYLAMSGLIFYGCQRSAWPSDNVPLPETGPTHELTIKPPASFHPSFKGFKVTVPVEANLSPEYPQFMKWGDDVTVSIFYTPEIKTDVVGEMEKSDRALQGKTKVPEGYAVVGQWRGTVKRFEGSMGWRLTYLLWNGKDFINASVRFAPNNPDSEKRATAIFNSAIRTLKGI